VQKDVYKKKEMLEYKVKRAAKSIQTINWYPYAIPFRQSFVTAHCPFAIRTGAIIEIITKDGHTGIGEIAPLPEFSGTDLKQSLEVLPEIAARMQGNTLENALKILEEEGDMAAQSGLELALLDAIGKCTGRTIAQLLQADRREIKRQVAVNAVVGARGNQEAAIQARKAVEQGFFCIKLKMVGEEQEQIERVAAVRAAIGKEIQLRLDANEGWDFEQARRMLKQCEGYDIQYIEQPLPAANIAGMRALQQETTIRLAADEAVNNPESARKILATRAAQVLILKPQLNGGLRRTQDIIREAERLGIDCVITSSIETGIGLMGALQLAAASPTVKMPCGLATLDLLEDDLLIENQPIEQGLMNVPTLPGLGIELDRVALKQYSVLPHN
jgi:L-Ala-D/L-Glu epimerase